MQPTLDTVWGNTIKDKNRFIVPYIKGTTKKSLSVSGPIGRLGFNGFITGEVNYVGHKNCFKNP